MVGQGRGNGRFDMSDLAKIIVGAITSLILAAIGYIATMVFSNKDKSTKLEERVSALEKRVLITKADVLEAIQESLKEALEERDQRAKERREEWDKTQEERDKRLALEFKDAAREAVSQCRETRPKHVTERIIRMIVREELDRGKSGRVEKNHN